MTKQQKEKFKQRNHSRYPCRCRGCNARKTLRKHPEDYKIRRRCPCGSEKGYRVDWYRLREESKARTCYGCYGYPFPHDKKTSPWCVDHPRGPTADDIRTRYGEEAALEYEQEIVSA